METFARSILNGAQSVQDGGIIGDVLRNVVLINNNRVVEDVRSRVTLRMSGGYTAAVIVGVLWVVGLLAMMVGLCFLEERQRRQQRGAPETPRRRQRLLNTATHLVAKMKAGKTQSLAQRGPLLQLLALVIVMAPLLLLLILALTNVAVLSQSLSSVSPVDSERPPTAMLPALKVSLFHLRSYLSSFADKARLDTKDTVEQIVLATKTMQNETMTRFNALLMARLGVSATFTHGDEMTRIVVAFFNLSKAIVKARDAYNEVKLQLFPASMNRQSGLFSLVSLLRDSFSQLPSCDTIDCKQYRAFFQRDFVSDDDFPDTVFASSFLFIMKQRNETPESVKAKSAHGRMAMAATMAKTKARMDILVDIPGTVRNMTSANWDNMDAQFSRVVATLDKVSISLDKASSVASRVSTIVALVMTLPLVLVVVVMSLSIILVCDGGRSRRLRLAVYGSLILLSLALFFSSVTFIIAGNVETELCRYLRTEQPVVSSKDSVNLVLDRDLNNVLPTIIRSLPKTDSPTPVPHNPLYGLVHGCRRNEPILVALDAVKSLNTSALSKPEASEKIVAIGRMLMLESLNETDPRKMMPADMAESLNQAAQMDMFKVDFGETLKKVPRSPLREVNGNTTRSVTIMTFVDRVSKYLDLYVPQFKDRGRGERIKQKYDAVLTLLQKFTLVTSHTRALLRQMQDTPKIGPVVQSLQKSLQDMLTLMTNKTRLLALANQYYDEVIVTSTPENTAKIMAVYGPKMMAQLGLCRPLFEAYRASVDIVCDVVVSKMNLSWLYLGAMALLLSGALSAILLLLVRASLATSSPSPQLSLQDPALNKPLVSVPPSAVPPSAVSEPSSRTSV